MLIPIAAGLGEVNWLLPGVVYHLLSPLLVGGCIHFLRKQSAYRGYLPWVLAVPVAVILDLLLYTGVTDAKARLGPLLIWLTHNFGWQGWVFQGQVAFGLLCLVMALRVPWTRGKLVVAEALDRDQALPPELRETIDDRLGEAILPRGRTNPGL